jgi:hypothetical protein
MGEEEQKAVGEVEQTERRHHERGGGAPAMGAGAPKRERGRGGVKR